MEGGARRFQGGPWSRHMAEEVDVQPVGPRTPSRWGPVCVLCTLQVRPRAGYCLSTMQVCFCRRERRVPQVLLKVLVRWGPGNPKSQLLGYAHRRPQQPKALGHTGVGEKGKGVAEGPAGRKGTGNQRQVWAAGDDTATAAPREPVGTGAIMK